MNSQFLIDETSSPPLRAMLGSLLATARAADFAIRRIRLAHIDLSAAELGPLHACRVLVNRLDAGLLHDRPGDPSRSTDASLRLLTFARTGRLAVRVAPTAGWNPDFSILHHVGDSRDHPSCLIGSHYFEEPDPPEGPAFTAVFHGPAAAALASARFDRLWHAAYDVLPAVIQALESLARP